MVRLRRVLTALYVFLIPAVMPYLIGRGCGNTGIERLVAESWFLMTQATRVLDEVISGQATPVCREAVLNILNTLVGTAVAGDQNAYVYIRNRFAEAANGVRRVGPDAANIMIHCQDPEITRTVTAEGQAPTTMHVHPVAMWRINGVPQQGAPNFLFGNAQNQLYYFLETEPDDAIPGYTIAVETGSGAMQVQQQHTGSTVAWSDVVLKAALTRIHRRYWSLEAVTDWTPNGLMHLRIDLLGLGRLPFTTIIHELMHTTALATPIAGHGIVDGNPANSITAVLELARTNDQSVLQNPETYAYLALDRKTDAPQALSMPWLKWWDSTNNQPDMNHRIFGPQYNTQTGPDGTLTVCLPGFNTVPATQPEIDQQLRRGPRAFMP